MSCTTQSGLSSALDQSGLPVPDGISEQGQSGKECLVCILVPVHMHIQMSIHAEVDY